MFHSYQLIKLNYTMSPSHRSAMILLPALLQRRPLQTLNSTSLRSSWFLARSPGSWIPASSNFLDWLRCTKHWHLRWTQKRVITVLYLTKCKMAQVLYIKLWVSHDYMHIPSPHITTHQIPYRAVAFCLDTCAVMRLQRKVRNRNCCCTKSSKP